MDIDEIQNHSWPYLFICYFRVDVRPDKVHLLLLTVPCYGHMIPPSQSGFSY